MKSPYIVAFEKWKDPSLPVEAREQARLRVVHGAALGNPFCLGVAGNKSIGLNADTGRLWVPQTCPCSVCTKARGGRPPF
jgi:hypothetical protein